MKRKQVLGVLIGCWRYGNIQKRFLFFFFSFPLCRWQKSGVDLRRETGHGPATFFSPSHGIDLSRGGADAKRNAVCLSGCPRRRRNERGTENFNEETTRAVGSSRNSHSLRPPRQPASQQQ